VNTKKISPIHFLATYLKINAPSVIRHFFYKLPFARVFFFGLQDIFKKREIKKRKIYEPCFHQVQVLKKFSSSEEVQV
jgi:hypothetical protein